MPTCIVRYHVTLEPASRLRSACEEGAALFDEEREPDEWGDPGRLVRRRLRKVEGPHADSWADRLNTRTPNWQLRLAERIGPVEWGDN